MAEQKVEHEVTWELPLFFQNLGRAHHARLARCIALTGNIHDLFALYEGEQTHFITLEDLLHRKLSRVLYQRKQEVERCAILMVKSDGVHFTYPKDQAELGTLSKLPERLNDSRTQGDYREVFGKRVSVATREKINELKENQEFLRLAADLKGVLGEFEKRNLNAYGKLKAICGLFRCLAQWRRIIDQEKLDLFIRPFCVVFDQADMIFPNAGADRMSNQDRESWTYFYDLLSDDEIWPEAETADERSDLILLLSPTSAELNNKLFVLPKVELVNIPLPDDKALKAFVTQRLNQFPVDNLYGGAKDAVSRLVNDARGLTLRTLDNLITAAHRDPEGSPLTREAITLEVNKQLTVELGETVKFSRPVHTMDDVVGFNKLKPRLRHLKRWIDDPKTAPSGMVVVGPNGAGKTFIIEAWAAGIGRVVLTIAGGMKSKWYGETEVFLEKFELAAARYGKVCIFIDEADDMLKALHDADAHETDKQFVRHLVQMIGNPKYRSKIFWVLATTRPDLLPPDFVRAGRCSLFIPIADPFEEQDMEDFFNWMLRRFQDKDITLSDEEKNFLRDKTRKERQEFSAGDYNEFINGFINSKDYHENELKKEFIPREFIESWKPSAIGIGLERKLQTLLLALKCGGWPEVIPPQYRDKTETELREQIEEVKMELRFR